MNGSKVVVVWESNENVAGNWTLEVMVKGEGAGEWNGSSAEGGGKNICGS